MQGSNHGKDGGAILRIGVTRMVIESHPERLHVLPSLNAYHLVPMCGFFTRHKNGRECKPAVQVAWLNLPSSGTWRPREVCFILDDSLINKHGQRLPFTQFCLPFVLEYPPENGLKENSIIIPQSWKGA